MEKGGQPEGLVDHLVRRLRRHDLWDSLSVFFPPLIAFFYLEIFFFTRDFIGVETLIFSLAGGLGVALALLFRRGWTAPSKRFAARLIDERVGGKDRFVTLATINPLLCPFFLLARLRDEAKALLYRIDLKKDFHYRVKRTSLSSLAGSLAVILLFHLLSQSTVVSGPYGPSAEELQVLAQQLSEVPRFSQLARALDELVVHIPIQDPPAAERLFLIQELLREIEDRRAGGQQGGEGESDLLDRVAVALRELEEGKKKREGQGGEGLKVSQLGEKEGKGKELSEGKGVEGRGGLAAWGGREQGGGKSARGETEETKKGKGEGRTGVGDRSRRERKKGREMGGSAKSEMEGGSPKSKEREIPRGKTPERYLQPGEKGEKGIKGARFVTVELPEGEEPALPSGLSKGSRRGLGRKVPVSNVPLPPFKGPDAAREKQFLPLEYRGLIR